MRPIGMKGNSGSSMDYLSPNTLLLGRCSERIDSGLLKKDGVVENNLKTIQSPFLLVQAIANQFWKIWMANYFPTLLIRQKWHQDKKKT